MVGCANVAALQVSRAARRHRRLAIQLAIGASRVDLAALVLLETLIVTGAAAISAIAIAVGPAPACLGRTG